MIRRFDMIQYIYFVKCPNCEDEPFDFFDEAKGYAMGCLTQKPVITQTEVCRNDFGECTDSADLGTVWSWEDVMGKETEAEPAVSVFTKDDFANFENDYNPDNDPEFANLDDSLDEETHARFAKPEGDRIKAFNNALKYAKKDNKPYIYGYANHTGKFFALEQPIKVADDDVFKAEQAFKSKYKNCKLIYTAYPDKAFIEEACEEASCRKPIPEGMTIEQLVEEMEENESEVECVWCNELCSKEDCHYDEEEGYICPDCQESTVKCTFCDGLFGKDQCRYEVDLGWLCSRCEMGIKSRGETLTFREGNYWDFLDEKLDLDFSNCINSSDMEIYGIKSIGESTYKAVLLKQFKDVDLRGLDATQDIHDEMLDLGGLFVFYFNKDGAPVLDSWNTKLLYSLGKCHIHFDDDRYEQAVVKELARNTIKEAYNEHTCPECGDESYDRETGFCNKCGFN